MAIAQTTVTNVIKLAVIIIVSSRWIPYGTYRIAPVLNCDSYDFSEVIQHGR